MSVCSFRLCEKPVHSKGLCSGHYQQSRRGQELTPLQQRTPRGTVRTCDLPGCDRPHYARGFCNPHWQQSRSGEPGKDRDQERLTSQQPCLHCGRPDRVDGQLFAFCSTACYHRHKRGGSPPDRNCVECGEAIDFFEITPTGRRRKRTSFRCSRCDQQWEHKQGWCMTKTEIAARDGWVCSIGGEALDPAIRFPDPRGVTIDHVIPRSLGGKDVPENVKLACWGHNRAKSNDPHYHPLGVLQ